VERDGVSLLAADGSHSRAQTSPTGYPQFDSVLLKKLGWWNELTASEKSAAEGKTWRLILGRNHPRGDEEPRLLALRHARDAPWSGTFRSDPGASQALYSRAPIWSRNTRSTTDVRSSGGCRRSQSIQQKNVADKDRREIP